MQLLKKNGVSIFIKKNINNNFLILKKLIIKIIFEIKAVLKELMEIFERLKEKKIVWSNNKSIALDFFFRKKNLERNLKSVFLFFFYKCKISEAFFWSNGYNLSKNSFQIFFSKSELRYLNIYFQILLDYFDMINIKLFDIYSRFEPKIFFEIKVKKNFKIILKKKFQMGFQKGLRLFLKIQEFGNLREGNFSFRIN